ncbi:Glutamate receptor, ionotropic kainate [Operophtera brumata]|uniref:Glutamate receptor, ionotropic kainate n=1 Tax=Operophtera brumata TaxID=104452 RepID=A0A0L7LUF2_OPEBR|nr:Glutamate receptor, ionotropic kainate [Operophtera brumata]
MISIITTISLACCISAASSSTVRETFYPIGGLFNDLSQKPSQKAFDNLLRLSGDVNYHGRSLLSKTVDSYSTAMELCKSTSDKERIIALIDARPTNGICDTVCLLANRYNISHLSVGWEPTDSMTEDLFTFAYHPPPDVISKAYTTLIKILQWDKFTIFYEDEGSFIRLQDVINSWPSLQEPIIFRKLYPDDDNRETFKHIFNVEQRSYHIIDCQYNNTYRYFEQIIQVNNNTEFQSFILTNLDAYQLELNQIPELMANVSTFRMTTSVQDKWIDIGMQSETNIEIPTTGFTGHIQFDEFGRRENFDLHYLKLNTSSKFAFAGTWNSNLNKITEDSNVQERSSAAAKGSKLMIATKIGKPYFTIETAPNGTVYYRGYAVDLVDKIFEQIKRNDASNDFKYQFYKVDGVGFGKPIPGSKRWDGILGELIDHKASLAACDLTITSERNAVVDFSIPFMTLGIGMLMKERDPEPPKMFSFVEPLSLDVWLMSQEDWVNPHPCNQNPENYQNIWSLYNCMAAGSRWISGMWWFFALIVTASYTANMSTFLSDSRRDNDLSDVKALADQKQNSNESLYQKLWSTMKSAKPSVFTFNNEEGLDRVNKSNGKYAFFMESTAIEYHIKRNCQLKKGLIDYAILSLQEAGELEILKKKWWEIEDNDAHCANRVKVEDDSGLQMQNTSGIFLVLGVGGILGLIVAIIDFMLDARQISVKERVSFSEALISEWRASINPKSLHKLAAPPRSAAPSTASPSPERERSQSRAVSVLRAATSFINFDEIY